MARSKLGLIGIIEKTKSVDYWQTMQMIADMGYQGIEGTPELLQGDVKKNLERFHQLDLEVITVSAGREILTDCLDQLIRDALALQAPHVTVWWGPCNSKDELLRDADLYNRAGRRLAKEGIKLCYHNHEHEFKTVYNGVYALDVLAEYTDPAALYFELDIAWAAFGGENPVKLLDKMAGRIPAVHVKDLYSLTKRDSFTAIGTGVVDIRQSVMKAVTTGVEWIVIEQDFLRNLSAIDTARLSSLYIRECGLLTEVTQGAQGDGSLVP